MSVNVRTKISQCACTEFGIPKAEKVEQKEGLKIMFKWRFFFLDIILDGEIFTYLKNKRLLWIVGKKFNVSFFKLEQYTISGDLQLVILTHLELIFHIPRNRLDDLHQQKLKTSVEEWYFKQRCRSFCLKFLFHPAILHTFLI